MGEADQRGWGAFLELGAWSARANIQTIFFYGVGGGGGEGVQLYSQRAGMIQNEAEVRGQVRAKMSKVGDLYDLGY